MGNIEYTTEIRDLAYIIAQYTSGFIGAIPEQDDFTLAEKCRKLIDKELGRG